MARAAGVVARVRRNACIPTTWLTGSTTAGETRAERTLLVVALTAIMMVVEITTGLVTGSMALLADGLRMASHTTALGIALFAYVLARRLATDPRFAFGVGKINSLGGYCDG